MPDWVGVASLKEIMHKGFFSLLKRIAEQHFRCWHYGNLSAVHGIPGLVGLSFGRSLIRKNGSFLCCYQDLFQTCCLAWSIVWEFSNNATDGLHSLVEMPILLATKLEKQSACSRCRSPTHDSYYILPLSHVLCHSCCQSLPSLSVCPLVPPTIW